MKNIHLTILRLSIGLTMLLSHGLPKLLVFSRLKTKFPDPILIGSEASLVLVIFAEVVCSILLITGTGIRFACIPLMVNMLVASFIFHANDPFPGKEMALIYLFCYICIFFGGSGPYALKFKKLIPNIKWLQWGFDIEEKKHHNIHT